MTSFFDDRTVVPAGTLRGPRVYSTDLLPELFDTTNIDSSIQIAGRALKIKILSRGRVTLNGAYLVSPMAVLLLRAYPDLLDGEGILPAVLSDRNGLGDFVASTETYAAVRITEAQIADHVSLVEGKIKQVMPWEVAHVAEQFRARLIEGMSSDTSLIHRVLIATGTYDEQRRAALIDAIGAVNLDRSANLRELIATEVPGALQEPLQRFATACYHGIGTGVVQCETGADLSPLSHFRAADLILTDRDASIAQLSDDSIFLRYFLAKALATIQVRNTLPASLIDDISFGNVHKVSSALRETGFQDRYEVILESYANISATPDASAALEGLDDAAIVQASSELAKMFEEAIAKELPSYQTREFEIEKEEFLSSSSDVLLEGVNATPIGNFVAVAKTIQSAAKAASTGVAAVKAKDHSKALASADKRRKEDIDEIIRGLGTSDSKKASLLEGIAALTDIQTVSNRRA